MSKAIQVFGDRIEFKLARRHGFGMLLGGENLLQLICRPIAASLKLGE